MYYTSCHLSKLAAVGEDEGKGPVETKRRNEGASPRNRVSTCAFQSCDLQGPVLAARRALW